MYQQGKIYIWQNQVGQLAYLNGTECTVTSCKMRFLSVFDNRWYEGWPTDSKPLYEYWGACIAEPGDLREKDAPSGERMITQMFEPRKLLTMS